MKKTLSTLAVLTVTATSAFAEGYVEIGGHFMMMSNPDEAGEAYGGSDNAAGISLEGAYGFELGNNFRLIANASYRHDDLDEQGRDDSDAIMDGDHMGPNANVSVHFLREFEAVTLGGFLGYSMADHENSDSERYETFYQGVEAHFDIGSSAIGYVQVGLGDEKSVDQSSGGFVNGKFGRIGLIHQTAQGAALGLEFELARAEDYEDEDENAYFRSLALSYEQELNANFNWIAELRHSYVSVPEDGDALKETSIYLGLRKTFGDKTPGALQRAGFIGDPYLIKRNGVYVPATD